MGLQPTGLQTPFLELAQLFLDMLDAKKENTSGLDNTLQSSVSSGGHGGGPTLQGQPQNGLAGALGGSHMQQTSYLDNDAKSTFVRLKQVRHLRTIRTNPYFFHSKTPLINPTGIDL